MNSPKVFKLKSKTFILSSKGSINLGLSINPLKTKKPVNLSINNNKVRANLIKLYLTPKPTNTPESSDGET